MLKLIEKYLQILLLMTWKHSQNYVKLQKKIFNKEYIVENNLTRIYKSAKQEIETVTSINELNQIKSRYLGKKSEIMELMKKLGQLPKEDRPAFGQKLNIIKIKIIRFD